MERATDLIKGKLPVMEVLKEYLELKPAGKNFKARCPFHEEKTPSFMVSPERNSWHCFGCNEGGDIFTFIMKHEGMEFFEALRILADKAGVELKRVNPEQERQFGVLYDLNEAAKDFYKERLKSDKRAIEYLKGRGILGETAASFELGVAGGGWDDLTVNLIKRGFRVEDIERAGLALKSEGRGTYFDRFRNRIMFPINNHSGQTVGFTGRVLPEMEAAEMMGKYVNSPETPIFYKSRILYGFYKAKGDIRSLRQAVVVEGQMDVLMAWQDGVKNVVASSGTALSLDHLQALRRGADNLIFNFDSDEAGAKATERAVELANSLDMNVKVLTLAEEKDVADLVKERPGVFKKLTGEAIPVMKFYILRHIPIGGEITAMKRGVRIVLGKIKNMRSAVERDYWIKELAVFSRIAPAVLMEEMRELEEGKKEREEERGKEERGVVNRWDLLSQRVLAEIIREDKRVEEVRGYVSPSFRTVAEGIIKGEEPKEDREKELFNLVYLESGLKEENLEELIRQLKIEALRDKKKNLLLEVQRLDRAGGSEGDINNIMGEFQQVSAELNSLF